MNLYKIRCNIYMKFVVDVFDYIGHNGPIITFAITCLYLLFVNKHLYFIVFLGGFWVNLIINNVLKSTIREPRPSRQVPYIDNDFKGAQIYGMPSGHAQMCFYNFGFLYCVNKYENWTLLTSLFISLTTLYQRYKFRRHTIPQLFVGTLVGFFIGYLICKLQN